MNVGKLGIPKLMKRQLPIVKFKYGHNIFDIGIERDPN